jgi:hypothetical protein
LSRISNFKLKILKSVSNDFITRKEIVLAYAKLVDEGENVEFVRVE